MWLAKADFLSIFKTIKNKGTSSNKTYLFSSFFPDCESLIRKMLVLEPMKRYTIEQIKKHRWMAAEPYAVPAPAGDPMRSPAHAPAQTDPNDQVLRLMQSLGIDPVKTKEVHSIFLVHMILQLLFVFRVHSQVWEVK